MSVDVTNPLDRYSPRLMRLFRRYLESYLARSFNAVRVAKAEPSDLDLDRPTVLYANHPCWWDPVVLAYVLGTLYPRHRFFGPMDATALDRYPILRRLGIFGIEPGSIAGARAFRRQARRILATPGCALCVTVQGAMVDVRSHPIRLKRGVAHLLGSGIAAQAVPVALEYPFWHERMPEALIRVGPAVCRTDVGGAGDGALRAALEGTLAELAAAAIARDAAGFDILIDGARRGVGGVYDLFRRLRRPADAWRFDPSHEAATRRG